MSRFWEIVFCVPLLFRRHVCLSNLKHVPTRKLPLTASKTVFSHLKEQNICPTTNWPLPVSTSSWAKRKRLKTTWHTGGPNSLHKRGRDSCLRAVLCYKRLFIKACMGWDTKIALTRRKRFKTAWDAGKQQRIQQGNKVSRFYLKT